MRARADAAAQALKGAFSQMDVSLSPPVKSCYIYFARFFQAMRAAVMIFPPPDGNQGI